MQVKLWLFVIVPALLPISVCAQESVRSLKGTGQFGAFLTPGQIDRWIFDGDKGETIIAHVFTKEFDPILELVRTVGKNDKDDQVLLSVDDPGSESRFMIRLAEKGQYKIRVRAFKDQGGGNYQLRVQRFKAKPLVQGQALVGSFDRAGNSHFYFQGVKDQIVIPDLKGAPSRSWTLLDFKGRPLANWAGAVHLPDNGECCLIVSGQAEYRFDLILREARQQKLVAGKEHSGSLRAGELDALSFQGKPGDFRVLEVEKKGDLTSRLLFAPVETKSEQRLTGAGDLPEIQFLPVASRGGRLRFAAVLGREGRYQLQLLADSSASYKLTARDPSEAIALGKETLGNLPVGGAVFYRFKAAPGQLLQASLSSQNFVPLLRLYDSNGTNVAASDNDTDTLESRITHMVLSEGTYRLQVSSVGDGGGGEFRQILKETKLKELTIGGRGQGSIQPGSIDFWTFPGKEGQTVFVNVRSATFEPVVSLRSPDGVRLLADNRGSAGTGSLFALRLPKTGRYTVWVSSSRGAGDYTVRLIDGD